MSKLALHSLLIVFGKIISGISSIAGGILLARWLSVEEYGTYSQLILIASTIVIFSDMCLPRSLYFFMPRAKDQNEKKSLAMLVMVVTILSSLIFALTIFPFASLFGEWMNNDFITLSVHYVSIYLFFLSITTLCEPLLISLEYVKTVAVLEIIIGIGLFLSIIIPLSLGLDYRNILLFMSSVLSIKLFVQITVFIVSKGKFIVGKITHKFFDIIKYSFPLAIDSMIGVVGRRLDQIIISTMFLPADYAIYARGAFELPIIATIPMTIFTLMLPEFSKDLSSNRVERVVWQFSDKTRKVALLFFPLTVFMMLLAEAFIVIMFSEKYLESVGIFRIYLLIIPLRISMLGAILKASGDTKYFLSGNLISLISNIIISVALISIIGTSGAAWGTVISILLYATYIYNKNCQVLKIRKMDLLPWKDLGKIMLVSIASGISTFVILMAIKSYINQMVLGILLYTLFYFGYGIVFKIFTQSDIQFVKETINKLKVNYTFS